MLALGTPLPDFQLPDVVSGKLVDTRQLSGKKALLVMFICRHCPYVKHVQTGIAQLGRDYSHKPVAIVAVSSNDAVSYPQDAPDSLREMAGELGFTFPFCHDETQDVARSFSAVCTPEFYVFDQNRRLAYRGQFDNSRRNSDIPVTGSNVRNALDALLNDEPVNQDQRPSIGCNIKWKTSGD